MPEYTKIWISGGLGCIGFNLAEKFLRLGYRTIVVDNINDHLYSKNIKYNKLKKLLDYGELFTFYEYDLCEGKVPGTEACDEVYMYHLAALPGVRGSLEKPKLYIENNINSTLAVVNYCKFLKGKLKLLVFASSSSVYGNSVKVPVKEEDMGNNPISPYAMSKIGCESLLSCYHHLYKIPIAICRFFSVFGPNMREDMAPYKFTKAIDEGTPITVYGDGESSRDWTYVSDIVNGLIRLKDVKVDFDIFNLGNSYPIKLDYFIKTIEKELGKRATIIREDRQPGDVDVTFANITKAKKAFGYKPKVSFEEGIHKFVRWYKNGNI